LTPAAVKKVVTTKAKEVVHTARNDTPICAEKLVTEADTQGIILYEMIRYI
jgi:hypothetical protein